MVVLVVLAALLASASAGFPYDNLFSKESVSISKSPKELLSCMARCIDHKVQNEIDNCLSNFPSSVISGIRKGRRQSGDQLVTMTKNELFKIVNCVSQSRDRVAQREFDVCDAKEPAQTIAAYNLCILKIVGPKQNPHDAFAANPQLIIENYECIRDNTVEYTHKEAEQMINFENCAREVYSETCGGHYTK